LIGSPNRFRVNGQLMGLFHVGESRRQAEGKLEFVGVKEMEDEDIVPFPLKVVQCPRQCPIFIQQIGEKNEQRPTLQSRRQFFRHPPQMRLPF
jgi:hypothetical protein